MKKTIMVVDDEVEILDLLSARLGAAGYLVTTYADPEKGLKALQNMKPDLIVLDMMMPKIDGIEFLRALRMESETAKTPVVMLTAKTQTSVMFEVQKFDVQDYIFKPFEAKELLQAIQKLI